MYIYIYIYIYIHITYCMTYMCICYIYINICPGRSFVGLYWRCPVLWVRSKNHGFWSGITGVLSARSLHTLGAPGPPIPPLPPRPGPRPPRPAPRPGPRAHDSRGLAVREASFCGACSTSDAHDLFEGTRRATSASARLFRPRKDLRTGWISRDVANFPPSSAAAEVSRLRK